MTKSRFIKHMGPKKNSRYNQGTINPKVCSKYISSCKNEPIIYRSGLELQFINYCENNSNITKWASEPIEIPYLSQLDGKQHTYNPDFVFERADGVRVIVEVKPENQTSKPDATDSLWLKKEWLRNVDKWKAAKLFADKHNMKFIIVTEKFFK